MGELHELLAVEQDKKQKAGIILKETANTFLKKPEHFDGLVKSYIPAEENGETIPAEKKHIVTNVKDKLEYNSESVTAAIDATLQKEETNSSGKAKAELVVNGTSFGELSATSLLALEQSITKIRDTYKYVPTLDPTRRWTKDEKEGTGIYVSDVETKFRTKKTIEAKILYHATDKQPAQVEKISVDQRIGTYETVYKSGKLTPAQKSDLLERIDDFIIAIKRTRAKANKAEVSNTKIGKKIFEHLHKGII